MKRPEFSDLSDELHLCIAGFFKPAEIARQQNVSKEWKLLLNENALWNQFLEEKYRVPPDDHKKSAKQIFRENEKYRLLKYRDLPLAPKWIRNVAEKTGVPKDLIHAWFLDKDENYQKVTNCEWYLENNNQNPPHPSALNLEQVLVLSFTQTIHLWKAVDYVKAGELSTDEVLTLRQPESMRLFGLGSPPAEALADYRDYRETHPITTPEFGNPGF